MANKAKTIFREYEDYVNSSDFERDVKYLIDECKQHHTSTAPFWLTVNVHFSSSDKEAGIIELQVNEEKFTRFFGVDDFKDMFNYKMYDQLTDLFGAWFHNHKIPIRASKKNCEPYDEKNAHYMNYGDPKIELFYDILIDEIAQE